MEPREPIEVPYTSLNAETLRAVIEEFVTRDGTDYGEQERTVAEKMSDVMRQLERKELKLVLDPVTNSVNIVLADRRREPASRGQWDRKRDG